MQSLVVNWIRTFRYLGFKQSFPGKSEVFLLNEALHQLSIYWRQTYMLSRKSNQTFLMHYPSYNALLLFPLCMFFSLDYIRLISISACFLDPMKLSSLRMAVPAPQYVHMSCFSSYSFFKCERCITDWNLGGCLQHLLMHHLRCFSIELHSLAQWGRVTHSFLVKSLNSVIAPVGKLYDRQGIHYLNANMLLRKINYFGSF